jgi:GNAT superfamily N-acetyltransferase
MSTLSDTTIAELDAFWAAQTSCLPGHFDTDGIAIVERPATDGSEYVQLFRRKQRLQITCSASLADLMREAARHASQEMIFDAAFLRRALAGRIDRIIGPAFLGYLDLIDAGPDDPSVRLLDVGDAGVLDGLRGSVTARDWEYSGLETGQPVAAYVASGAVVSAAGYDVWGGRIAHIGVVTRPGERGRGCGRRCVRAIAGHAIARGLIAQYRTLYENAGAMAIAHALGFDEYAATIYAAST